MESIFGGEDDSAERMAQAQLQAERERIAAAERETARQEQVRQQQLAEAAASKKAEEAAMVAKTEKAKQDLATQQQADLATGAKQFFDQRLAQSKAAMAGAAAAGLPGTEALRAKPQAVPTGGLAGQSNLLALSGANVPQLGGRRYV